ncbi:glycosyltransferase [Algoriphagus halophytocola]|uniref:Glycosyltransferase n=1 Tax=Algoriphagus halophytocola TaxID=2991499 RepID=A0ABY6MF02_9BACT|nr:MULTISPECIES: glycosyltransferase family protein [unclassified Algoriphagus]UZD22385.1 glycosyltransferase [Algoriphagus sp. TR-M5]WBL43644.1 glycosyltransferase [Algoriphagus sp. TR-M9]
MKFVFIVQGEGRGHMTQAIAFGKMLENQGHEMAAVVLGKSKRREVPPFFSKQIHAPIYQVESPNFACDKNEKKILIGKTIRQNIIKATTFWRSLQQINTIVQSEAPDVILNFYDLLGGLYNGIFRPNAAYWVIGHQYLIYHPAFQFAPTKGLNKFFFKFNTRMTALGASQKLALSFYPLESTDNITVVPPLLREEVRNLTPTKGDFYLTYMVNSGYSTEVIAFAKSNPHLKIRAYWDKKEAEETETPLPNLSFHRVHDKNFLRDMAACKGLVSTAGFESICEAMYLRKPVMVIPVAGQYEQACNALDTVHSGAGIASDNFDFSKLDKQIQTTSNSTSSFQDWVSTWPSVWQHILPETKMTEPDFILTQSFS